jgi:hemoglobin-like flavoprotein
MTPEQIAFIKASWKQVAKLDATVVGQLFYTRLFEVNPELQSLFKSPQPEQSKKLIAMLGYIISRLDKLDEVTGEIQRLAQRHVQYGVKERHYNMVGAALLWTLKKGLGEQWSVELEEAWTKCYGTLSSAMIDASQEAELV